VIFLLLIPESRKQPLTESLLYKQVIRFFEEEKIRDKFEIAFITIEDGIFPISDFRFIFESLRASQSLERQISDFVNQKSKIINHKSSKLPPQNFRSGRSWVSKAQINQMADSIVDYLRFKISDCGFNKSKIENHKSEIKALAYVRGSYLEAVREANKKLRVTDYELQVTSVLAEEELTQLKKKGIRWMKIGLRMPEAFDIFKARIRKIAKEGESRQLTLF
jgi:hypothetical protein